MFQYFRTSQVAFFVDMSDQDNRDPQGAVATLELMAEIYTDAGSNAKAADAYRTAASIHKNFSHDTLAQKMLEKAENLENDS